MLNGLSIIIPFYNTPNDLLHRCLRSILASYSGSGFSLPLEIVMVNDGSSGDYSALIEHYSAQLPVRYIRQSNMGRSAARNAGIANVSYEIIGFMDADDMVCLNYFVVLNEYLGGVSPGHFLTFSYFINKTPVLRLRNPFTGRDVSYRDFHFFCTDSIFLPKTMVADQGFDERLSSGEDIRLWTQLLDKYTAEHINLPITVYFYDYKSYDRSSKRWQSV